MSWGSTGQWLLRGGGFLAMVVLAQLTAGWLGLEYWQPLINNQTLKIYTYQQDNLTSDIIFLGTSKTNRTVIPDVVEQELAGESLGPVSTFCLGQRGLGAQVQGIILRDVLESNDSPRLVVLGVTPASLNANHSGISDVLRFYASPADLARNIPRLRTPAHWQAAGRGLFRGMTSMWLRVWCGMRGDERGEQQASIRRLKGGRYRLLSPKRMQRLDQMPKNERQETLRRKSLQGRLLYMKDYHIGGAAVEGLEEIIFLTRRHGIGLALFNPPVTPEYRRAQYRPKEYAEYLGYIESITQREGIPFLDLDDGRLHLTIADFYDFGHLNAVGAQKASRRLARQLVGPALEELPVPGRKRP